VALLDLGKDGEALGGKCLIEGFVLFARLALAG